MRVADRVSAARNQESAKGHYAEQLSTEFGCNEKGFACVHQRQ